MQRVCFACNQNKALALLKPWMGGASPALTRKGGGLRVSQRATLRCKCERERRGAVLRYFFFPALPAFGLSTSAFASAASLARRRALSRAVLSRVAVWPAS